MKVPAKPARVLPHFVCPVTLIRYSTQAIIPVETHQDRKSPRTVPSSSISPTSLSKVKRCGWTSTEQLVLPSKRDSRSSYSLAPPKLEDSPSFDKSKSQQLKILKVSLHDKGTRVIISVEFPSQSIDQGTLLVTKDSQGLKRLLQTQTLEYTDFPIVVSPVDFHST